MGNSTSVVDAEDPCPFLRALVASGEISPDSEPLSGVTAKILRVAASGEGSPKLQSSKVRVIALVANGLSPVKLLRTIRWGMRIDGLRKGPLDKNGVGSGIIDAQGNITQSEILRLDSFASDKRLPDGRIERGLNSVEIVRYMDANFSRAAGKRRAFDRKRMDGEWPPLLQVLGLESIDGRYLSVDDVSRLFIERRLPSRMLDRLGDTRSGE